MSNIAVRDLLRDIIAYGHEAIDTVSDLTSEQILSERFREHAVLRTVQIIGEASAQVVKLDATIVTRAPELRQAIGLRNVLVHGYAKIRMDEIVRIVRAEMPALLGRVAAILEEDFE